MPSSDEIMQIRKRFVARVWNSHSPEAGRRRERRQFPKDMLQPRPDTGRNYHTAQRVGRPKARVGRRVAACSTGIARTPSRTPGRHSGACLQDIQSDEAVTTTYPFRLAIYNLSSPTDAYISPRQRRPSGKSRDAGRQRGGPPTDASCSG